jgi:hypothetical protein
VPGNIASRGDRHRNRREQDGDQRGQIEEAAGAIDRGADLRTGIGDIDDALARLLHFSQSLLEGTDGRRLAGEQREMRNAAALLRQAGRFDIVETHHQRRRQVHELRALIRSIVEHASDGQLAGADANPVTDIGAELREQSRFEPGFAFARDCASFLGGAEWHIGNLHATAQWISFRDRADRGQRAVVTLEHDARKVRQLGSLQTRLSGELKVFTLDRGA